MLVRCTDDEESNGLLEIGKIYDVDYVGLSYFEFDGQYWSRSRFEIIEENV